MHINVHFAFFIWPLHWSSFYFRPKLEDFFPKEVDRFAEHLFVFLHFLIKKCAFYLKVPGNERSLP